MPTLKLQSVGSSTGIVLSDEMLARMRVEPGDTLCAVESESGYLLTPFDPEIAAQVEMGREIMKEYRETFKKLAE